MNVASSKTLSEEEAVVLISCIFFHFLRLLETLKAFMASTTPYTSIAIGMNVAWGGVSQKKLEKDSKKKAVAEL